MKKAIPNVISYSGTFTQGNEFFRWHASNQTGNAFIRNQIWVMVERHGGYVTVALPRDVIFGPAQDNPNEFFENHIARHVAEYWTYFTQVAPFGPVGLEIDHDGAVVTRAEFIDANAGEDIHAVPDLLSAMLDEQRKQTELLRQLMPTEITVTSDVIVQPSVSEEVLNAWPVYINDEDAMSCDKGVGACCVSEFMQTVPGKRLKFSHVKAALIAHINQYHQGEVNG